jgi:hypothetical protein
MLKNQDEEARIGFFWVTVVTSDGGGSFEHGNEPSGSVKFGEFR